MNDGNTHHALETSHFELLGIVQNFKEHLNCRACDRLISVYIFE